VSQPAQPKAKLCRIDLLLVEKGLAPTREKAQRLLMAGEVLVNDQPCSKAGAKVSTSAQLRLRSGLGPQYVSRGAFKLLGALDAWKLEVSHRYALDVGASTGGFTEVLLSRGASKVYAVDVGHSQMDWKLRTDPRVVVIEKTNARNMPFETIGRPVDFIVMDVSFISAKKILPNLVQFSHLETEWIILVKPQFELSKDDISKGGIVTDPRLHLQALTEVIACGKQLGLECIEKMESPIQGTDGNTEFLVHFRRSKAETENSI
jgi:23S rRNA (cytidine1920-2'-O)/16S rRNA (cytidine1409-2'-O)-methyltransferase